MYGPGYLPTPVSDPQVLAQVAHARLERPERVCEHGRPFIMDATGHSQSTCYACPDYSQLPFFHALHLPQFLPVPDTSLARRSAEASAFSSPQAVMQVRGDRHDIRPHPYGGSLYYSYPYLDPTNGARRKAATKETTHPLKVWLTDHRKNPYPTKAEKILLAIMTKMSLTQVSTWFANARRRLKKENKMNYENNSDANSGGGNSPPAGEDNSASNGETPHASGSEKTHNSEDEDIEVSDISDGEVGRGKVDDAKDNDEIDESVSPHLREAYNQMMQNREEEKEEDDVIVKARPSPSGSKSPMAIVVPSGIQRPKGEGSNDNGTPRGKIWSISNILESGPKPSASSPPTHPPPAEAFFPRLQYPVNMAGAWQYPSPLTVGHQPHPLRLPFPSASTATTATVSVLSSPSCSPVKCQVTSPPTTEDAGCQQRASHSPPDSVIDPGQSPQRHEDEGETEALNLKTEPHSDASQQSRL